MPLPQTEMPGRLQAHFAERGIRMTQQRRAILRVMETASKHLDAAQLLRKAQKLDASVDRSTVYRTLQLLKRNGLIDELDLMHILRIIATDSHALILGSEVCALWLRTMPGGRERENSRRRAIHSSDLARRPPFGSMPEASSTPQQRCRRIAKRTTEIQFRLRRAPHPGP